MTQLEKLYEEVIEKLGTLANQRKMAEQRVREEYAQYGNACREYNYLYAFLPAAAAAVYLRHTTKEPTELLDDIKPYIE